MFFSTSALGPPKRLRLLITSITHFTRTDTPHQITHIKKKHNIDFCGAHWIQELDNLFLTFVLVPEALHTDETPLREPVLTNKLNQYLRTQPFSTTHYMTSDLITFNCGAAQVTRGAVCSIGVQQRSKRTETPDEG